MDHFGSKIAHPHNSRSAGRIFFKFCTMKEADGSMRMIVIIFQEKNCLEKMDYFGPKNLHCHNSGSAVRANR